MKYVTQMVKDQPAIQETWVWSLGWEDPLEEGMATYSSTLAWRIPWTEEPGGLQSIGSQRVRPNWVHTRPDRDTESSDAVQDANIKIWLLLTLPIWSWKSLRKWPKQECYCELLPTSPCFLETGTKLSCETSPPCTWRRRTCLSPKQDKRMPRRILTNRPC